jgi:putative transposase
MQETTGISQRRACGLAGISRSVMACQPKPDGNNDLRNKIIDLAQVRRRFGYRRIHALLRRAGIEVNVKRVYRLYTEENLAVRRRKRKKGIAVERQPLMLPEAPNEVWSMDFVMDRLCNGNR